MKLAHQPMAIVIGASALAALSFLAGKVWAGGVPSTGALTYSGTLLTDTGAVLKDESRNIEVKLWSDGSSGTDPLCTTGSKPVPLRAGHFSISLPDKCTQAVHDNSDAWIEVFVDGATLGRVKLGAVPYSLETKHAVTADNAGSATSADAANAAAGALQTTLQNLQDRLAAIEAAYLRTADRFAVAKTDVSANAAQSWDGCVGQGNALACQNLVSRACIDKGYLAGIWDQEWASADGTAWSIRCIK